jgi:hypothetical protein
MEAGDYIHALATSLQEEKVSSTTYIGSWLGPTTSLKFLPYWEQNYAPLIIQSIA